MTRPAETPRLAAVAIFACFAFAYFFSALVRAVVATLAPAFSADLGLGAADLGLLAGAYFAGFASTQLPLGSALDRFGPRRVLLACLAVAVIGCAWFALAAGFAGMTAARVLIGMGVSACLMAPMTFFRNHFPPQTQVRTASWMMMTGSFGMVASTLPVQWLMPQLGWRGIFWLVAASFATAMAAVALVVPSPPPVRRVAQEGCAGGYREVFRHRSFIRLVPIGFFHYGSLLALQTLWVGPWLVRVCGWTPQLAARGLFTINVSMLLAFLAWGALVPRLYARGCTAQLLITRGVPVSLVVLATAVALGARATTFAWALFCVSSTVVALALPAIGQAFASSLAGRALTAFNLVIFLGVFALQWFIGAVIDRLEAFGWTAEAAFQGAFLLPLAGCCASYAWFLWFDDRRPRSTDNLAPCRES